MPIKLMIKEHTDTGLRYLCMTRKEDHETYPGSGTRWIDHLEAYGYNFTTKVIFETDDPSLFKKEALRVSKIYDVVKDKSWANLRPEEGDGGDTVSNRMWITNGFEEKYIFKTEEIPENWKRGRYKCVFSDTTKQKEFATRVDLLKRGNRIKDAWEDRASNGLGKRTGTGVKGAMNPACRPEVREKIKQARLKLPAKECPKCGRMTKSLGMHLKGCVK